jgi:peptide methionine sulfoxide reductase MsrA
VNHDPTVTDRQFCDSGSHTGRIFYHSDEQKKLAEASKAKWEKQKPFKQPLSRRSPRRARSTGEDYHQDYYRRTRCSTVLRHRLRRYAA